MQELSLELANSTARLKCSCCVKENVRLTVRDPMYSPQQGFAKFGLWLGSGEDRNDPLVEELIDVANFIVTHDPAVVTCLAGQRPDYTGQDVQHFSEN